MSEILQSLSELALAVWDRIPGDGLGDKLAVLGLAGAVLGFVIARYRRLRGKDVESGVEQLSESLDEMKESLSAEIADLKKQLQTAESEGGGDAALAGAGAPAGDGLGADLDAGIDTLLKAGRADALRDKSGEAAQTAIEELIAERARARERIAADEAALYRQKGAFAFLHDTHGAMAAYARAVELYPDDPEGWNELGRLQLRTGALDAAINSFERVLALGNKLADKTWEAAATGNLGAIYLTRGDLDRAEAMHKRDLELSEELGSKEGQARATCNLGNIYLTRGELDRAEAMFKRDLALSEELGSKEGQARATGNLGAIYLTRGELDRAEAMFKRQLELAQELGHKEYQGNALGNLGNLYQQQGDTTRACQHWARARDLFREIGSPTAAQVEGWMRDAGCPE